MRKLLLFTLLVFISCKKDSDIRPSCCDGRRIPSLKHMQLEVYELRLVGTQISGSFENIPGIQMKAHFVDEATGYIRWINEGNGIDWKGDTYHQNQSIPFSYSQTKDRVHITIQPIVLSITSQRMFPMEHFTGHYTVTIVSLPNGRNGLSFYKDGNLSGKETLVYLQEPL